MPKQERENKVEELLSRGVANVIPSREELKKVLLSNRKLNVYLGIDPTATHIHLGHAVPLRKLQSLVELGHNVTFLIGDFTALIGDTSDKESERPILTGEEINTNFRTYKKQAEKIIDFSRVKIRYNSEWLSKLNYEEVIQLFKHFSLNDFISRELIKKRLESGGSVRFDEVSYPVMQGYDSYFMDTDLQIGGTDQTFNMQAGRVLQKDLRHKESYVLTTTFLEGTDGRKMSKSWGNAIWLDDPANDIYGKVMSLKDGLIVSYLTLGTGLPMSYIAEKEEVLKKGGSPMNIKKELAFEVAKELWDETEARKAQANFEKVFQSREIPKDLPIIPIKKSQKCTLIDIMVNIGGIGSRSEAKRLINEGAVEVDGKMMRDIRFQLPRETEEAIIKIGKTRFLKIHLCD